MWTLKDSAPATINLDPPDVGGYSPAYERQAHDMDFVPLFHGLKWCHVFCVLDYGGLVRGDRSFRAWGAGTSGPANWSVNLAKSTLNGAEYSSFLVPPDVASSWKFPGSVAPVFIVFFCVVRMRSITKSTFAVWNNGRSYCACLLSLIR